jgi:hypothetical protein
MSIDIGSLARTVGAVAVPGVTVQQPVDRSNAASGAAGAGFLCCVEPLGQQHDVRVMPS